MAKEIKNLILKYKFEAILFTLVLFFFSPVLIAPSYFSDKDNDLGRNYIPIIHFYRQSLLEYKQLPLWRSEQMMGEPTAANPLYQYLYPGNLIFLPFAENYGALFFYIIHFLVAAFGTYYFCKAKALSKQSSLAAAIFYALSIKMVLHTAAGHLTMVAAFSYFPIVVLGVSQLIKKLNFKWLVITAVSMWFMYINYPTVFYYSFIFVAIYIFYYLLKSKNKTNVIKKFSLTFFVLFIVWLGLSAISIIPQLEFAPLSTRSDLQITDIAIPLWNMKKFFLSLFLPYAIFNSLDHESLLYLGLIPTLLSAFIFTKLTKLQKSFLIVVGFLTIIIVLNRSTPIFPFVYKYLPLLNYSRVTTRMWFAVAFIAAVLSAYAFDRFKKPQLTLILLLIYLAEVTSIFYGKTAAIGNLNFSNEKIYSFLSNDKELNRVYCTTYCFNPQLLFLNKIQILNGENPIQQKTFVNFLETAGGYKQTQFAVIFPPYQLWQVENKPLPSPDILGMANVKFVVSAYQINEPELKFIEKVSDLFVYQNAKFQKRAFFLENDSPVEITKATPNEIKLKFAPAAYKRDIVYSENYYPGWRVTNNNLKQPIESYKGVFRKFSVAANTREATIKFESKSYALGKTITLATISLLILFYFRKRIGKK
ncbi:YfhO family protein [Candidatus Curtissbacteria bacterium]|nr:YfhO family protein [Candidatus Curtissbacteria bacterium]